MNQNRLSTLLDRLTISLRARERRAAADVGLQPVHLQILGYLAKCNRFSNTPIAVSEYLGDSKRYDLAICRAASRQRLRGETERLDGPAPGEVDAH